MCNFGRRKDCFQRTERNAETLFLGWKPSHSDEPPHLQKYEREIFGYHVSRKCVSPKGLVKQPQ